MKSQTVSTGMIDPKLLEPNPWNSNSVSADNEIKLETSIKKFGMFKPVIVRTLKDGTLQILGGEHRARAAGRLGLKEIPIVNLGEIDEKKAKEIGLVDNGRYGADDTIALADILRDLDVEDLTTYMPISTEEINNIFSSADIDLDSLEMMLPDSSDLEPAAEKPLDGSGEIASGKTTQTHAIMRFKVPVEDAEKITEMISQVIKVQGLNGGDSLSNAGDALIFLLEKGEE